MKNRFGIAALLLLLALPGVVAAQTFFTKALPVSQTIVMDLLEEGAACDGITNDAAAIQAAIEKAADRAADAVSPLTVVIRVPHGVCNIGDNRLTLQTSGAAAAANITIQGLGPSSVLAWQFNAATPSDSLGLAIVGVNSVNVTIENLRVTGLVGHGYNRGLYFDGGRNITIRNCEIDAGGLSNAITWAAGIAFTRGTSDSQILNNYVHDIGQSDQIAYSIVMYSTANEGAHRVLIQGNRVIAAPGETNKSDFGIIGFDSTYLNISSNYIEGMTLPHDVSPGGYGIAVYQLPGATAGWHIIEGNHIKSLEGSGVYVQKSQHTVISSNVIEDVANVQDAATLVVGGIAINEGPATVRNNTIRNVGIGTAAVVEPSGIAVQSEDGGCAVVGNTITNSESRGIELRGPIINGVFSNNTIIDAAEGGIVTSGNASNRFTNLSIVGNSIIRTVAPTIGDVGISLHYTTDSTISANTVIGVGGQGVLAITQVVRCVFSNNIIMNPSQFALRTSNGMDIRDTGQHIITGNISTSDETPKSNVYGIQVTGDSCTVVDNHGGGDTGAFNLSGTNLVSDNNRDVSAL